MAILVDQLTHAIEALGLDGDLEEQVLDAITDVLEPKPAINRCAAAPAETKNREWLSTAQVAAKDVHHDITNDAGETRFGDWIKLISVVEEGGFDTTRGTPGNDLAGFRRAPRFYKFEEVSVLYELSISEGGTHFPIYLGETGNAQRRFANEYALHGASITSSLEPLIIDGYDIFVRYFTVALNRKQRSNAEHRVLMAIDYAFNTDGTERGKARRAELQRL